MNASTRVCFVLVGLLMVFGFAVLVLAFPSQKPLDKIDIACIATLEFIGAWLAMFGVMSKPEKD